MENDDDQTYIKLISADSTEIFLELIRFPDIGGSTLEKIVKYLHYKDKYSNSTSRIPEFQIDPDEALELLVAANYLNC
eukprot:CCRYP_002407-RA/>CCRYP_002407-RA protein AED:0.41 eAED:0.41 QI:0/0.5/0.66/1/0/0/3/394/77